MNSKTSDHELERLEQELKPHLSGYLARSPQSKDTHALIQRLQPEFERLRSGRERDVLKEEPLDRPSFRKHCLLQLRSYPPAFWIASVLVFAMLTLITRGTGPDYRGMHDLFAYAVPLFLFVSLVYSYRTWNREMRMLESVTPFPPALIMLSRISIMLFLCLVFGLSGTLYLALTVREVEWLLFLLQWLSPMVLLGGWIAWLVFRRGMVFGMAASFMIWLVWSAGNEWILRNGWRWNESLWLAFALVSVAVGALLFIFAYRHGRYENRAGSEWQKGGYV